MTFRTEMARGEAFAEAVDALVAEHGPEGLSPTERAALTHEIILAATDWARRRNRLAMAAAQP